MIFYEFVFVYNCSSLSLSLSLSRSVALSLYLKKIQTEDPSHFLVDEYALVEIKYEGNGVYR